MAVTIRRLFGILVLYFILNIARAQDIEEIVKGKKLEVNGNIGISQTYYSVKGRSPSRKPFNYMLIGNLNLKIFGFVNAPFSIVYSNLGSTITQPTFNQTSFHPKYKWVQLHLGNIAQSWSPYTLNGHMHSGAGVELTPGNFNFSITAGRFVKAVQPTGVVNGSMVLPAFERKGMGIKLGYRLGSQAEIVNSIFYAKDDTTSLIKQEKYDMIPKENLSFSSKLGINLKKTLRLQADFGRSWWHNNIRLNSSSEGLKDMSVFNAIKLKLETLLAGQTINFAYERIDPEYRTMGAYFFNNDLENYTIGTAIKLLKSKVQIQGNCGKQRDNLNGNKLSIMKRNVASINLNWTLPANSQLNLAYSNFLTHTNLRSFAEYATNTNPYFAWDTLNFRQLSQNANLGLSINLKSDTLTRNYLNLQATAQNTADRRNGVVENGALFINAALAIARVGIKSGNRLTLSCNVAQTGFNNTHRWNYGPMLGWAKAILAGKAKWNVSCAYVMARQATATTQNLPMQSTLNLRSGLSATLHRIHQLHFSALLLQSNTQGWVKESTITLHYAVVIK